MYELSDDEVFEPDNSNYHRNVSFTSSSPFDRRSRFIFPHLSNNDSGYDTRGQSSHSFSDLETCSLETPGIAPPTVIRPNTNTRHRRISETMTAATTSTVRATSFDYHSCSPPCISFAASSSSSSRSTQGDAMSVVATCTNTAVTTVATNTSSAAVAIICSNQKSSHARRASWPGQISHRGSGLEPRGTGSAGGSLGRSPQTSSPRHHLCSVGTQTSGSFESLLDALSLDNDYPSDNEPFDDDNVFSPSPSSLCAAGPILASSVPDVILPAPSHCRLAESGLNRTRFSSLPVMSRARRADEPIDRYYGSELRRFADQFSDVLVVNTANRRRRRTLSVQVRVNLLSRSNLYPGVYVFCFVVARWLWNSFWRSRRLR